MDKICIIVALNIFTWNRKKKYIFGLLDSNSKILNVWVATNALRIRDVEVGKKLEKGIERYKENVAYKFSSECECYSMH